MIQRPIKQLFEVLTPHERRNAKILFLTMVGRSVMEIVGIFSVSPFLAVLGNPNLIRTNRYLVRLMEISGVESFDGFLLMLGVFSIMVLVLTSAFKAFTDYAMFRFGELRAYNFSMRLFKAFVRQNYSFFILNNTSQLQKLILSEVNLVIGCVLLPSLYLLSSTMVAVSLLLVLLIADLKLAVTLILFILLVYYLVGKITHRRISRAGKDRSDADRERFRISSETFGGIKELKLHGCEEAYIEAFSRPVLKFAEAGTTNLTLSTTPRYFIEAAGFTAILFMAIYVIGRGQGLGTILPLLGIYAFAAQRLLPSLQLIMNSISTIKYGEKALDNLYNAMISSKEEGIEADPTDVSEPLSMKVGLEVANLSFTYQESSQPSLSGVSFKLRAGCSMGITGKTGSGKTTLVDLLLGLLRPSGGSILVDGVELDESNIRSWQRNIGYVPQDIFLIDDTITRNIAFGIPQNQIDHESVKRSAEQAQINEFVSSLPDGLDTVIGENGVRLSGGQRQRIGIARALYRNPDVLVLDEATSALDNATEDDVMTAISALSGSKTVIIIAHRLSTVEKCDFIIKLDGGKLVGDEATLVSTADSFPRRDNDE